MHRARIYPTRLQGAAPAITLVPLAARARSRTIRAAGLALGVGIVLLAAGVAGSRQSGSALPAAAAGGQAGIVRILGGEPATIDPAAIGDSTSAGVAAQLFESLTSYDADLHLQPALAAGWTIADDGRRIVFHLRPGLTFSDGTPLRADDVVQSWLRVIDPGHPSPLASLMDDVDGAADFRAGHLVDAAAVGLAADRQDVTVRLVAAAGEFPAIVSGPTFAILPPRARSDQQAMQPSEAFVSSGAYRLVEQASDHLRLVANDRYWAGRPAVGEIRLVTDLGGRGSVAAYEAGELDYAQIGSSDASWIRYDRTLGPDLREVASLSVTYYGFDARRPPFDDPRVRRAFARAVDWDRIIRLTGPAVQEAVTSLVPPGIPGRTSRDLGAIHDPAAARADLAAAGYPGGRGFPTITMVTPGFRSDGAVLARLAAELGIHVNYEVMDSGTYFGRLSSDPPAFWAVSWVADYPGPNDFLGILLGTGQENNYGGWANPEFDAAIAAARAATSPSPARAAYDRAEILIRDDAPVIPVSYGSGWALSRSGLLGATDNGLALPRFAGLAWEAGK